MTDKYLIKTFIIRTKFELKKLYKKKEFIEQDIKLCKECFDINNEVLNSYKGEKIKSIENLNKIKIIKRENVRLQNIIEKNTKDRLDIINEIQNMGSAILAISIYVDKFFSLKEKIHLISGNTESCNSIVKFCKKENNEEPGFLDLIVQHGEYQNNKQRSQDFVDCPNWEMPLFNAILKPMFKKMSNAGIDIRDCPIFEQMPYYIKDNNGNLIRNKSEVIREEGNITIVRF